MASFLTEDNMVIAYDNQVNAATVDEIELINCAPITGSAVENLLYPDASLDLLTTSPSDDPIIRIKLLNSYSVKCLGICNHNIASQYDGIEVEWGSSDTGPWTHIAEATFTGTPKFLNPDLLLRFPPTGVANFRVTFKKASAWPAFRLGYLMLGTYFELIQNPLPSGFITTYSKVLNSRRAAGGARHRPRGPVYDALTSEISFTRITKVDRGNIEDALRGYNDDTVAIVPPDVSGEVLPFYGRSHLFCNILDRIETARSGVLGVTDHRYDMTLTCEGIV